MDFVKKDNNKYLASADVKNLLFSLSPQLAYAYDDLKKQYQDDVMWACDELKLINIVYDEQYEDVLDYDIENLLLDEELSVFVDIDDCRFKLIALQDCNFYILIQYLDDINEEE